MLKKSITYTNPFTDQRVTEEHYFHISKADLVEMEMEEHGATYVKDGEELTGMQAKLQQIVDSEDGRAILREFKNIIHRAYGKKVGERFLKSEEIWQEFASSEAYSQLIFELCTDAVAAGEFVTGVIPSNLDQVTADLQKNARTNGGVGRTPEELTPEELENVQTLQRDNLPTRTRILTPQEIENMDPEELKSGIANGTYKLS